MVFDVQAARDWIIVIAGLVSIVVSVAFLVMALLLYGKMRDIVNRVTAITNLVEQSIRSPYFQIASLVGSLFAKFGKGSQK
jgi:hypothetical protein